MTVSRATFLERRPEFANTPVTLVDACLVDAELMIDREYYGTKADAGVMAYAAHLIAINPLGEMARLDKHGEKTTYLLEWERIKRSLGAGFRVI